MVHPLLARAARLVGVAILLGPLSVRADELAQQRSLNWHQWRGPEANGFAPHGDPPTTWSEQSNVKWKSPIPGRGTSTPIVWQDRIFLLTAIKTDRQLDPPPPEPVTEAEKRAAKNRPTNYHQFAVVCLDRRSGRTLWQQVASEIVPHQGHHKTSTFVAASPVTDGRYLYCSFGSRGVHCYDLEGNPRWKAELGQFTIKFGFGEGSSPVLSGDLLIVNCDHEEGSFLVALDANSGQQKWKVARDESSTWNTPLVTAFNGRTQVIVNGAKRARSYDLASGELLWEYGGTADVDAIPSPLRLGELAIFTSGLKGNPAYAIPLSASGDLTDTDRLAWKHTAGTPQISSPVLVGERLYFTKDRAGILTCLDARTGQPIIDQKRLPGLEELYSSPVAAAGRVYFCGRNGKTVVIDATADEVSVLAENQLDETIDASPAIVDREIFLRGDQSLYCIGQ